MPKEKVTTKSAATKKKKSEVTAVETPVAESSAAPAPAPEVAEQAKPKAETAKKTAPIKTSGATKKPASKTTSAKETVAVTITTIIAKVDVGYGNSLYLRGEGGGLSWNQGVPMQNAGTDEWYWSTISATERFVFKFLLNDELWNEGENLTAAPGETVIASPRF